MNSRFSSCLSSIPNCLNLAVTISLFLPQTPKILGAQSTSPHPTLLHPSYPHTRPLTAPHLYTTPPPAHYIVTTAAPTSSPPTKLLRGSLKGQTRTTTRPVTQNPLIYNLPLLVTGLAPLLILPSLPPLNYPLNHLDLEPLGPCSVQTHPLQTPPSPHPA